MVQSWKAAVDNKVPLISTFKLIPLVDCIVLYFTSTKMTVTDLVSKGFKQKSVDKYIKKSLKKSQYPTSLI